MNYANATCSSGIFCPKGFRKVFSASNKQAQCPSYQNALSAKKYVVVFRRFNAVQNILTAITQL